MRVKRLDPLDIALDGFNLVEASAGTGKTHALTSLYLRLVMERDLHVRNILVVTYTKAATEELRLKIRKRLKTALSILKKTSCPGEDSFAEGLVRSLKERGAISGEELVLRLEEALLCMDESAVFTIHSFCQRMLREFAFESSAPLRAEILPSEEEILRRGCTEFVRKYFFNADRQLLEWTGRLFSLDNLPDALYHAVSRLVRLPLPRIIHPCSMEEVMEEAELLCGKQKELSEMEKKQIDFLKKELRKIVLTELEALTGFLAGRFAKRSEFPGGFWAELEKGLKKELNVLLKSGAEALRELQDSEGALPSRVPDVAIYDPAGLGSRRFIPLLLESFLAWDNSRKSKKFKKVLMPFRRSFCQAVDTWLEERKKEGPSPGMERLARDPALGIVSEMVRVHGGINERLRSAVLCQATDFVRNFSKAKKKELSAMTYDDMLVILRDALHDEGRGALLSSRIRKRFPVALIDEFQDTDSVQWQIFRKIYSPSGRSGLFLIGDPKQAIYGFRGADIFTYLNAREQVQEDRRYNLARNWRSSPGLVQAVNWIFRERSSGSNTFVLRGIEFTPAEARVDIDEILQVEDGNEARAMEIWLFPGEEGKDSRARSGDGDASAPRDPAGLTALEIKRLISLGRDGRAFFLNKDGEKRPVVSGDITVLVRNFMEAASIRKALYKAGVPSVYQGPGSVFRSAEARDILYMLNAVENPADTTSLCTALGTVCLGFSAPAIHELRQNREAWEAMVEKFSDFRAVWLKRGVFPMLRLLFHEFDVPERLLCLKDGERRLTNMRQIAEMLAEAEREHDGPERLVLWLSENIREPDDRADEQRLRLETDENLVKVMSYHRSKGLEFPILFLPFIDRVGLDEKMDQIPRLYSREHGCYICPMAEKMPSGTDELQNENKGGNGRSCALPRGWRQELERQKEAERVRLVYVALTRAKHKLFIAFSSSRALGGSTLGRILLGGAKSRIPENDSPQRLLEREFEGCSHAAVLNNEEKFSMMHKISAVEKGRAERPRVRPPLRVKRHPLAPRVWMQTSFSALSRRQAHSGAFFPDAHGSEGPLREDSALDIFNFPRGPAAGNCVHHLFETIDFRERAADFAAPARQALERFRLDGKWAQVLADTAEQVCTVELADGISLSRLDPASMSREMAFVQPFAQGQIRHFPPHREYCMQGAVKGFVDLVFQQGDAFYILDYKTNWLGDKLEDYDQAALERAMEEHDYWLQAGIYAAALHGHLSVNLRGYLPDRHMGGIFYVFIRGVRPEHGSRYGVKFISKGEILERYPGFFSL